MASFMDRIKILLEIDDTGGVKALTRFRDSIKAADGVSGKFKATASGAFDYAKDHAAALAAAGGAALVAFGVKSVGAFVDMSKAAIDFGSATGLATEDASRWIAVGDDFGVTAEELTAGVGKIAKSLDDTKWAEYGIATRDAAGNARSANDILIDSLSTLSSIKNETERARVGNELFGKGYKSLAPILGHTADQYRDMLGAVEKGQVITEKEAAKAERFRLAQDALSDALQEVTLAVGGFVASMGPMIERAAQGITTLTDLADRFDVVKEIAVAGMDPIGTLFDAASREVKTYNKLVGELVDGLVEAEGATADATDTEVTWEDAVKAAKDATDAAVKKAEELTKAREDLISGTLSAIDAEYAYMNQAIDSTKAVEEYNTQLAEGSIAAGDLWQSTDAVRQKMVDTAKAYADTTGAAKDSDQYIKAMITSLVNQAIALDPGSPLRVALQGYIDQLRSIPGIVSTQFQVTGPNVTVGGHQVATVPRFADGGVMPGPIGQHSLALVAGGETILPTHKGPVSLGGGGDVYIQTNWDERRLVQTLNRYVRRGGRLG